MTVCKTVKMSYEKDKDNFVVFRGVNGYRVQNERNGKSYFVNKENGSIKCNCPDFIYRRAAAGECCKHQIAVKQAYETVRLPELPVKKVEIDVDLEKYISRW